MPQFKLPLQHGPQDALLLDCSRSYFNNVGYVRTCDFQQEIKDITSTNTAAFGTTTHFTVDRAADLLGQMDLVMDLTVTQARAAHTSTKWEIDALVDGFGYAMIDTIKITVGTNEIQEIQGEWLAIENALTRDKDFRYNDMVLMDNKAVGAHTHQRAINNGDEPGASKQTRKFEIIVPLSTFFSKHPSQFLPLAAVAGCNDIKIAVKLRPFSDLVFYAGDYDTADDTFAAKTAPFTATAASLTPSMNFVLRSHYYHVPGPEANALISKEHVRLIKGQQRLKSHIIKKEDLTVDIAKKHSINLSFLHPVTELIFVIRSDNDLNGANTVAAPRSYFSYLGRPNSTQSDETLRSSSLANEQLATRADLGVEFLDWNFVINGNSYHPETMTRNYTIKRLLPMTHSEGYSSKEVADGGTPEIYGVSFAMNPEGHNPSGHLNFSKVSYSKLELNLKPGNSWAPASTGDLYVDIYANYYNWTQIKDGRVVNSFQ